METNKHLYKPREICKLYGITPRTLLNWSYNRRIKFIRTDTGHRRYYFEDSTKPAGRKICYCRVSSQGQKEDLERQSNYMRLRYPSYEIITDIGSGINFKRKGFNAILDSAIKGDVAEIVVTHRDRLCRFGFELVERLVTKCSHGVIVVLDHKETSPNEELVCDLISIVTVFSSRIYGLRSHKIKNKIKEAAKEAYENNEIQALSK
jgi:predicted site-specific integrase-resolvase